jgi:hypothetical protein
VNYSRIALAGLGGTVAYFIVGFVIFGLIPTLRNEFARFPPIYRTQEDMKRVMPIGMLGMLVGILVLAVLYAMMNHTGAGASEGARFGALIGLFAVCAFVLHNYVNLNIGGMLTAQQAVAYLLEWTVVGTVIGMIYRA